MLSGSIREEFSHMRAFELGLQDAWDFASHYRKREQCDQRLAVGKECYQVWGVVVSS